MGYNESQLSLLINSGNKIIEVVSYEWQRVHGMVNEVAEDMHTTWQIWSLFKGVQCWDSDERVYKQINDANFTDPIRVLEYFDDYKGNLILILEDFHPFLEEHNYQVIRKLREVIRNSTGKTIILSQPHVLIPKDLSKDIALYEVALPDNKTLDIILRKIARNYPKLKIDRTDKILSAALGLTVMEAEIAFTKAIIENQQLTEKEIPIIIQEKENLIRKNGLLEYYTPSQSLDAIGGNENLKEWVKIRAKAFDVKATEYGIPTPKGLLLLGVPGCGKSLTAKVLAKTWNFPLLKFDLGKVFGGIVGESEKNIREALAVSEALAPCVLWIDEIEKGLSGVKSSTHTDGGTTARVFGTILTWMQEKKKPVFVVATANDISLLPPELLRKGRFDEIFFVDLPTLSERKNIFKIHIENKRRNPKNFDVDGFAKLAKGFTGAEIEEVVNEALFLAYNENREPVNQDYIKSIQSIYPLSKTMSETISSLRNWAKVRARLSSKEDSEQIISDVAIPKLKQETFNPFMDEVGEPK